MPRIIRLVAGIVLAGAALSGAVSAHAQAVGKPLIIGGTRLLQIRAADRVNGNLMSIDQRINHVQDVYAKHLGGQAGRITWKQVGDRVHLYLNGDFVLGVSPFDAKLNGYKGADKLGPVWAKALTRGFAEGHVRSTPGRP